MSCLVVWPTPARSEFVPSSSGRCKRIGYAATPLDGLRFRASHTGKLCAIAIAVSKGRDLYVLCENARRGPPPGYFVCLDASHFSPKDTLGGGERDQEGVNKSLYKVMHQLVPRSRSRRVSAAVVQLATRRVCRRR